MSAKSKRPAGWREEHVFHLDCRGWWMADGSTLVRVRLGPAANPVMTAEAPTVDEALIRLGQMLSAEQALARNTLDVRVDD